MRAEHVRLAKAGLLGVGLCSVLAGLAIVVRGATRVNTGRGPGSTDMAWLIEFNWVALAACGLGLGLALTGAVWFCYLASGGVRERGDRNTDGRDHG
jgi:hypothetical protein